ncbi:hypothetical protein Q9L58_006108, partial [Maublancomyces gigas]
VLLETLVIIRDNMKKAEETKPESPSPPAPTQSAPKNYASVAATPKPPPPPPKKATPPTIHGWPFNKTQRQLIVQLTETPPAHVTDDLLLSTANEATKNTTTRFCLTRRSQKGNLVILTVPSIAASEGLKQQQQLHDAFKTLGYSTGTIRQNAIWTRLLVHNIPTALWAEASAKTASAIEETYPLITQSRPPRWLTTNAQREGKPHSTMVITIPFAADLDTLGLKYLTLFNKDCKLALYQHLPTPAPRLTNKT